MANMDNWRLSKIEEELEKLDIHQLDREPYGGNRGRRVDEESLSGMSPTSPTSPVSITTTASMVVRQRGTYATPEADQLIYSRAIIKPVEGEKEAVRKITEKYDSLGKVKPLKEIESRSEENLAAPQHPGAAYSTGSLGRRRDVGPLAAAPPKDEYIHIAPEVVAEYPVPSAPMSNLNAQDRKLVESDILQVEMFFRSHRTDVFVCTCMVHMYFGSLTGSPTKAQPDNWQYVKSGLLVLVMDNGEARSRGRRIAIVLAEKGTGFQIWKDQINKLTDYKAASMGFHTMHLSSDHTRRVGFGYDDTVCASEFHRKLLSLTTDPNNEDILNVGTPGKSRRRRKEAEKKNKKYKAPSKSDISSPCCFTHITKLDRTDGINIVGSVAPNKPSQRDLRTRRLSPVKMTRVSSLIHHDT